MWEKHRVNEKFLNTLRKKFGTRVFSNKEAYEMYARKHANRDKFFNIGTLPDFIMEVRRVPWTAVVDKSMLQMNVRNNLCAAVYKGGYGLERIGPGVYQFVK